MDPGFRGHLTLCLVNMGAESVSVRAGDRIVQMIFSEVSDGDEIYNGRYQDSNGVVITSYSIHYTKLYENRRYKMY